MANELCTLADYKKLKGLNATTEDEKIQSFITFTSKLIRNYCNRDFDINTYTEYFSSATNCVFLMNYPVVSVASVSYSNDGGVTQTALTENTDYFVDYDRDAITTGTNQFFYANPSISFKSLEVVYDAGYTEIPLDLQLVAMDVVEYYLKDRDVPNMSLAGATLNNPQPYIANSWPPHIRRVLDLYRYIT